jgi:hypothetical protein
MDLNVTAEEVDVLMFIVLQAFYLNFQKMVPLKDFSMN